MIVIIKVNHIVFHYLAEKFFMLGEWILEEMEPCDLPEKVASGFSQAFSDMTRADYMSVLYCGHQLVHGINHIIICKQTLVISDKAEYLVKVILNEILPSDSEENGILF